MSLFSRIFAEFNTVGLNEKSRLTEYEVNHAIDKLCHQSAGINEFDRQVAEQIWEHSTKAPDGKVLLKDYVQTLIDARRILEDNVEKCQTQLGFEQDPERRQELEECLLSYTEDLRIIAEPFRLEQKQSGLASVSKSRIERSKNASNNNSHIFTEAPSGNEESTSLKLVFIIAFFLLLTEVICLYVRQQFFSLLVLVEVLSIFLMNYFDGTFIKFCLITLGLSVFLDLLWAIIFSSDYWSPPHQTQFSRLQDGFLKFVYIATIALMIGKALLLVLLFRFRKNEQGARKTVRILNKKIFLEANGSQNAITRLLTSKNAPTTTAE